MNGDDYQVSSSKLDDGAEWLGNVDTFDGRSLRGWAYWSPDPSRPLWVEVIWGTQVVGVGRTGRARPDVAEAHGIEGQPGFRVNLMLPPDMGRLAVDADIWVRIRDVGVVVAPFPLPVEERPRQTALNRLRQHSMPDEVVAGPVSADFPTASQTRAIAFYLPQFHPFKENDEWWGAGFTEWRNVARAVPQYEGHDQPRIPTDLGYYDLRLRSTLPEQGRLAKEYGLAGFCFYVYWFAGRPLMTEVLDQLNDGVDPIVDFCLCWANETWSRRWDGSEQEVLLGQEHDAGTDVAFIDYVMPLLKHPKYLKVDGKPVLLVYRVDILDDPRTMIEGWQKRAIDEGLGGLFVVMAETFGNSDPRPYGFDGSVQFPPHGVNVAEQDYEELKASPDFSGKLYAYDEAAESALAELGPRPWPRFPGVMPGWDNTPRRGTRSHVFTDATVEGYESWLYRAANSNSGVSPGGERLVFINAWNEWAEGAYLEPDTSTGFARLQATRSALTGLASPEMLSAELARMADDQSDPSVASILAAGARSMQSLSRSSRLMAKMLQTTLAPPEYLLPGDPFDGFTTNEAAAPGWLEHVSGKTGSVVAVGQGIELVVGGWSLAALTDGEAAERFLVLRSVDEPDCSYFVSIASSEARPLLIEEGLTSSAGVAASAGFQVRFTTAGVPAGRYGLELVARATGVQGFTEFNKHLVIVG